MPSLSVGGVSIPVAISSPSWSVLDNVDRARRFDNSFSASQSGGAAREWDFQTPPVTIALGATYRAALASPASTLCSGDILQLPTMCSPQLTGGTPIRASGGQYEVLQFKLHESQAARVLLRYSPGDVITGESFSRSTTAYQTNASGVLVSKAINVKRDGHYIGGVVSTLLEDTKTNICPQSADFTMTWAPNGAAITRTPDAYVAPDGTTTADLIADNATTDSNYGVVQAVTVVNATRYSFSVYAKYVPFVTWRYIQINTAFGVTYFDIQNGVVVGGGTHTSQRITPLGSNWYRLEVTFTTTGTTATVNITPTDTSSTSAHVGVVGIGMALWGAQLELGDVSSYVGTTTIAVARGMDNYYLPAPPPQEMTGYIKFFEGGTAAAGGSATVWYIGDAANSLKQLSVQAPGGGLYRTQHNPLGVSVNSTTATAPAFGDSDELLTNLFGDGSVQLTQSINGGTATTAAQSAAAALQTSWADIRAYLNSIGSAYAGFIAIQSFKIVSGSRSLSEMRAL